MASRRTPGQARSRAPARSAQTARRCSQLSSTSSRRRARRASWRVASTGRPGPSRTPRAAATARGTSAGSARASSSASHTPSGYGPLAPLLPGAPSARRPPPARCGRPPARGGSCLRPPGRPGSPAGPRPGAGAPGRGRPPARRSRSGRRGGCGPGPRGRRPGWGALREGRRTAGESPPPGWWRPGRWWPRRARLPAPPEAGAGRPRTGPGRPLAGRPGEGPHHLPVGLLAPGIERQLAPGVALGRPPVPGRQVRRGQGVEALQGGLLQLLPLEQEPLLEGLALRQTEAGQELAPVQRRRRLQVGHGVAADQTREAGHVQIDAGARVPLHRLAGDVDVGGRAARRCPPRGAPGAASASPASVCRSRTRVWLRFRRAAWSGWSGHSSPARLVRGWGRPASTAR